MARGKKKYLIVAVIVVAILLTGGYFLYPMINQKSGNQKYRTLKVDRGEISVVVTATGTINPVVTVLVGSQISGTIKDLQADFNSRVREGQVIAQIDPAIFEAQVEQGRANVLNAQANLLNAQANLKNAQANLNKAEISVIDTKRTLDRNKELIEKKVIAQAAFDTAQTNYDSAIAQREVAKAQFESARAQLESSKAQIEQAKAGLKVSETNLRYTTIRSPVNGIVISRNVDVGQTVAASLQAPTLFTIAKDLTQMQVDTNVSEADIGRIGIDQEATFTVDAYPDRTFRGKVSEIRNAPTTVQNVVTYNVVIQVDNSDLKLKPGMTANVSVMIEHRESVLRIPNSALRFRPESARAEGPVEKKKEASKQTPSAPEKGRAGLDRLKSELNLTPDQQSKMDMILQASRAEIQEIREKSKPEEASVRIRTLIRQKIWGILTEEQRKKLKEMAQSQPKERGRPARLWVVSQENKAIPVQIVVGVTDGTFSEVMSGDFQDGSEVIVEEISSKKATSKSATPAPFTKGLR
ncbi:MAG: efflux RND transporter periplasmic adaptor subunit [Deltaproteobacteria bacterium]|nr:efflux RND transporter periplasmic adaptor subunit [Deltaproteobacteria bacterium]